LRTPIRFSPNNKGLSLMLRGATQCCCCVVMVLCKAV
jgi:hypothetical protein